MFLVKEKALYSTLNKFKTEGGLYIGFCWIPNIDNQTVMRQIEGLKEKNRNIDIPTFKVVKDHGIKPPTLFRTNDVTWVFQEIVNTYGIPNYKEVNPTVFTVVTFPFLFGIMFGDIGHGAVLFLVGAMLCLFEDVIRTKAPSMEGVLVLRYIALLMGLFATFSGVVYNDLMAIPVWIWDSCYDIKEIPYTHHEGVHERAPMRAIFK
jgi:V-type H+-transporting ATPase subunit a